MTKQELIKIIQSLPDCLNIELSNEVPVPYEASYYRGYCRRPISMVDTTTTNKCSMNITIGYRI
jgi:hypothetical protein